MWIDDLIFSQAVEGVHVKTWIPSSPCVVLGSSNQENSEVNIEYCHELDIPILKRSGGGGTVVLYPGCVVLSVGCWVRDFFKNSYYFSQLNTALINVLTEEFGDIDFSQRGISDLCVGDKKFCGTSLFRSKSYLLYQASILCELDLDLIDKCLKHPTREPDYRAARSHSDFLVGLQQINASLTASNVCDLLKNNYQKQVQIQLAADLVEPDLGHVERILARGK